MSTIKAINIQHPSSPNTNIVMDSSGNMTVAGTVSGGTPMSGMRNRIINGDMRIDQRWAGSANTPGFSQYTIDRWAANMTQASKYSFQQNAGSVTPPPGFINYHGVTSTSSYSVGSTDWFTLQQGIEGNNIADLDWGKSTAKPVTLSFWVRSSLTGLFGGSLANSDVSRSYPYSFTINSSNTWEYKTITIPGDTTGTWLTTNGVGIRLYINLGSGSSQLGPANAWVSAFDSGPTGAVSVVGTSGATFYITGVQLEEGTIATPFERRFYSSELILCQRYYTKLSGQPYTNFATGISQTTSMGLFTLTIPTLMRAEPGVTFSNLIVTDRIGYDLTVTGVNGAFGFSTSTNGYLALAHSGTSIAARTALLSAVSTAGQTGHIALSAEL